MENKSPTRISDSEWEVMAVLWRQSPLSSHRVVEAVREVKDWSPKTIKTLLGRLVKKGALGYETEANRYLYFPLISREDSVREETRSFVDRVFAGDLPAMLLQFVQSAELSQEEVDRLRSVLDEKNTEDEKNTAGEKNTKEKS